MFLKLLTTRGKVSWQWDKNVDRWIRRWYLCADPFNSVLSLYRNQLIDLFFKLIGWYLYSIKILGQNKLIIDNTIHIKFWESSNWINSFPMKLKLDEKFRFIENQIELTLSVQDKLKNTTFEIPNFPKF